MVSVCVQENYVPEVLNKLKRLSKLHGTCYVLLGISVLPIQTSVEAIIQIQCLRACFPTTDISPTYTINLVRNYEIAGKKNKNNNI